MDTLGLVLKIMVTEADIQDRQGIQWLLSAIEGDFPRLSKIWADGNYDGPLVEWVKEFWGYDLDIVSRRPEAQGFEVLPHRWVVERTFAWGSHYRRLAKDYEYHLSSSEAMFYAAMIHLMVRRLARLTSHHYAF